MTNVTTMLREWIGHIQPSKPVLDERRMQIRNLTRGTVVGTSIDVADSGERRRRGLLDHTGLREGEGLWIVPCESVHTFFMKFPIDLIYLNRAGIVVSVRAHVVPWRMSMCLRAHSILELPSGTIMSTRTGPGDQIEVVPSPTEPVLDAD